MVLDVADNREARGTVTTPTGDHGREARRVADDDGFAPTVQAPRVRPGHQGPRAPTAG